MHSPGDIIGSYTLERHLGGGGFAEVWLGRHTALTNRRAAIKIPRLPDAARALFDEARVLDKLTHPGIVDVLDIARHAHPPHLVLEYVPGRSLRQMIAEPGLPVADAVAILRRVLIALDYAHKQGVIHRDIKPENILVHEDAARLGLNQPGMVKLADFGLGKSVQQQSIELTLHEELTDARATIAGTLVYMSPEQRSGRDVDHTTDLFACGVVLFELLTGQQPVGPATPTGLRPGLPAYLDQVYAKACAPRSSRFESASAMLEALDPAHAINPSTGGRLVTPPPPTPQRTTADACARCGRKVLPTDNFCMSCGNQLTPTIARCRSCGAYPAPGDSYCLRCGKALTIPLA